MMNKAIGVNDQSARFSAATELNKNVVILAGAGTGKTTLLIERLLGLILAKEIPIEKIVALTFTKKASEEIRERLENKLRSIIEGKLESPLLLQKFRFHKSKWKILATAALENIPRAQIGTIHSFAGHLLRLFPVQAEVDPQFQEDEGNIFDGVFEDIWWRWLEAELVEDSGRPELWMGLLGKVDLSELKDLGRALSSPLVDLENLNRKVSLKEICKVSSDQLEELVKKLGIPARAPVFSKGIQALRKIFSEQGKLGSEKDALIEDVEKISLPKDWAEDPHALMAMDRLVKVAEALARVNDELVSDMISAVIPLARRVRNDLRKRGAISFDGLLILARDLVRDHPAVRSELKRMYDAFLIDEFQDTDPLQGEILLYLAEEPETAAKHWRKVKLGAGRLFVVGDPKQSIYRFRGADIAAFEEFVNMMLEQGAVESVLSSNFRSHQHILDSVNQIFPPIMKAEKFLQPPYLEIFPGLDSEKREGVSFIAVDCKASEKSPHSSDLRGFEADLIAEWIKSHIGKPVGGKPLAYRDIALLFRSSYAFDLYIEALKDHDIPYLAEGEKTFFRRPEISNLFNILAAVANPEDKMALVGILRSPVGGLNDLEITQLKETDGFDYRREPQIFTERLGPIFLLLKSLNAKAPFIPISELIRQVFRETWLLEITASTHQGEQALANLEKVLQMSLKWQREELLTLPGFVRRFHEFFEEEVEEGENPLADSLVDAVKVITIHKAKGLEFPVVFLPNLSAPKGFSKKGKDVLSRDWRRELVGIQIPGSGVINSAMVLLTDEMKRREELEEVRVFYVAMTRAQEKLTLIVRNTKDTFRSTFGRLLKMAGALPTEKKIAVKLAGTEISVSSKNWKRIVPAPKDTTVSDEMSGSDTSFLAAKIKERENELANLANRGLVLSPSSMMQEREKPRVQEMLEETERVRAIDVGLLCHKVLEWWDFKIERIKIPAALEAHLEKASRVLELLSRDSRSKMAWEEANDILSGFFQSEVYSRIAGGKVLGKEIPFLYPANPETAQKAGGVVMRGVIDLIYEVEEQVIIADYKTSRFEGEIHPETLKSFQLQGAVYVEALLKTTGRVPAFEIIALRQGKALRLF